MENDEVFTETYEESISITSLCKWLLLYVLKE